MISNGENSRFFKLLTMALIEKASPSFDIFSLGMTLHVLLTRKMDRPDLKEMEEVFNGELSKVKIAREKLNEWSENLEEIVKKAIRMECGIKDFMTMWITYGIIINAERYLDLMALRISR